MIKTGQKLLTLVGKKLSFFSIMNTIEVWCIILLFLFFVWVIFFRKPENLSDLWLLGLFEPMALLLLLLLLLLLVFGAILALSGIVVSIIAIVTKEGPIGIISLISFFILIITFIVK